MGPHPFYGPTHIAILSQALYNRYHEYRHSLFLSPSNRRWTRWSSFQQRDWYDQRNQPHGRRNHRPNGFYLHFCRSVEFRHFPWPRHDTTGQAAPNFEQRCAIFGGLHDYSRCLPITWIAAGLAGISYPSRKIHDCFGWGHDALGRGHLQCIQSRQANGGSQEGLRPFTHRDSHERWLWWHNEAVSVASDRWERRKLTGLSYLCQPSEGDPSTPVALCWYCCNEFFGLGFILYPKLVDVRTSTLGLVVH